jgi:anti-anti-sigma factor
MQRVADTLIIIPTSDLSELAYQPLEAGTGHVLSVFNDGSVKNVVLDFHKTGYFGSSALEFFIRLWKRVAERKGRMVFCNVSATEQEILRIAKLDHLWPVAGSRAEAMRMVSSKSHEKIRTIVFPKVAELEKAPNAGIHAARRLGGPANQEDRLSSGQTLKNRQRPR